MELKMVKKLKNQMKKIHFNLTNKRNSRLISVVDLYRD